MEDDTQNGFDHVKGNRSIFFTGTPDFTPYEFKDILYAKGANAIWKELSANVDFSRPDADEENLRLAIMKSEGLPRIK
jgi:hypothetical protein